MPVRRCDISPWWVLPALSSLYSDSLGFQGGAGCVWRLPRGSVPGSVDPSPGLAGRLSQQQTPEGAPAPPTALALGDTEHRVIPKALCQPSQVSSELKSEATEGQSPASTL